MLPQIERLRQTGYCSSCCLVLETVKENEEP